MRNARRSKRSMRTQLLTAIAAGVFSAAGAHATLLFDSMTPGESGSAPLYYTGGAADEFMGGGFALTPGATNISGFDVNVLNTTGMNLSGIRLNIYVWGAVNTGAISSTAPAFSNMLAEYTLTDTADALPNGYYTAYETGSPGNTSGISLATPLSIPSNTIGLSFNFQGTTDGTNFNSMSGLTSLISTGVPPAVGSNAQGGFDLAVNGETNGNFTSGPYTFGLTDETYTARVYGSAVAVAPDLWLNKSGGTWSDGTQWSSGNPPTNGIDAVFNLSSAGYTVEIPAAETVNNLFVLKDNVTFDLDAQLSRVTGSLTLAVGQQSTGSLTLVNSGLIATGIVQFGAITLGANGGTGKITVTNSTYLYSNNDTNIGPGSVLSIGAFGKFGTSTLTIAGSTDAWTGKLDIGTTSVNIRNGNLTTVINQLKSGLANGSWTGQGITSSAAAADTTHLTAIGAILNNDGNGNPIWGAGTALGTFNGDNPAPTITSVLLRYTYYGDANLDGQVDASDYSRIDNGFLLHLTGWYNGDFNYDGVVNGSDYTLIDNAYNSQGPNLVTSPNSPPENALTAGENLIAPEVTALSATFTGTNHPIGSSIDPAVVADPLVTSTAQIASSSVPEPASIGLLSLVALPMLRRRSARKAR